MGTTSFITASSAILGSHIGSFQPIFQPIFTHDTSFFDEGPNQNLPRQSLAVEQSVMSSSLSNLSSSYPYLQGIEISTQAQYDAGFVKIWSGEPGHRMPQLTFDEGVEVVSSPFSDGTSDSFNVFSKTVTDFNENMHFPVLQFPLQNTSENPHLNARTFLYKTIVVKANDGRTVQYRLDQDLESTVMSSIIEPLAIRLTPSFYNSDVPVSVNQVRGFAGQGNADPSGACDDVVTVDRFWATSGMTKSKAPGQAPFIDDQLGLNPQEYFTNTVLDVTGSYYGVFFNDTLAGVYYPSDAFGLYAPVTSSYAFAQLSGSAGTFLITGSFRFNSTQFNEETIDELMYQGVLAQSEKTLDMPEKRPAFFSVASAPFADVRYVRNVPAPATESTSMLNVMSLMTGSTDNYVSYDEVSATCGWYYDNNTSVGTDSLAFGGMTY